MEESWREAPRFRELRSRGDACIILDAESYSTVKGTNFLLKWYQGDGVEVCIDRYDVRNYLEYEKLPENLRSLNGIEEISSEVDDEESLCEEERYRDLEEKKNLREEEEHGNLGNDEDYSKRKFSDDKNSEQSSYGEDINDDELVAIHKSSSNHTRNSTSQESSVSTPENNSPEENRDKNGLEDEQMVLVNGMQVPRSVRLRRILHKTAIFVRKNKNPQVEFLIRVNQRDNVDLSFMNMSDRFYKYYSAVKNGEVTLSEEDMRLLEDDQKVLPEKSVSNKDITSDPGHKENAETQVNVHAGASTVYENEHYPYYYFHSPHLVYGGYPTFYTWNSYPYVNTFPMQDNVVEPNSSKLKGIIEKVANFVAKNGPQFEEKVRRLQINNPDFNFLNPHDHHNLYYGHVLDIARNKLNSSETTSYKDASKIAPYAGTNEAVFHTDASEVNLPADLPQNSSPKRKRPNLP